jgi:predicted nucleic acid-binding protein
VSTVLVLDASAAVRAVMDAAAQPTLMDELASAAVVLAPGLLRVEAANALWKYHRAKIIDAPAARGRHAELCALVHRFLDEQPLVPEALQMAADLDRPVNGAVYAVVARRHAGVVLTFDRRLQWLCERAAIPSRLLD